MKTLINKIRNKKNKKSNNQENNSDINIQKCSENKDNNENNENNENEKRYTYANDTLKIKPKKGIPINISLPPVMSSLDILSDRDIRKTIIPPLAVSGLLTLYSKYNKSILEEDLENSQLINIVGGLSSLYFMK